MKNQLSKVQLFYYQSLCKTLNINVGDMSDLINFKTAVNSFNKFLTTEINESYTSDYTNVHEFFEDEFNILEVLEGSIYMIEENEILNKYYFKTIEQIFECKIEYINTINEIIIFKLSY